MMRGPTLITVALLALASGAGSARASEPPAPWWSVGAEVTPSNLPPGGEGTILVVASDLSAVPVNGSGGHGVVMSDEVPAGLTATGISPPTRNGTTGSCSLASVQCTFTGVLNPYERLVMAIKVKVNEPTGTATPLPNEVRVEGGGAAQGVSNTQNVEVSGSPTPFGVQPGFSLVPYEAGGAPATAAGSHPFELTTTLTLNQTGEASTREPVALPRNLSFQLPLGLIGDPQATEQCPTSDFTAHAPVSEVDQCPPGSVVGVASVTINEPAVVKVATLTVPLFNLVPSEGEPARFGFEVLGLVPVVIDTSVSPSHDYGVTATVKNASQLTGLLSSQVTFWGVPGDPRHSESRGWECINGGVHFEKGEVSTPCPTSTNLAQTPLLTLPTACEADPASEPVSSSLELDSWSQPEYVKVPPYVWSGPLEEPLGFTGCAELPFGPTISAVPEKQAASTPTGLSVDVKVPQDTTVEPNAEGRAEADVRDTTVTLPAGIQVNPSSANGLQACSEADVGFTGFEDFQPGSPTAVFSEGFDFTPSGEPEAGQDFCPAASKLGTVRVKTPLLPRELEGALYLAQPAPNGESEAGKNPFNSLIALYLVAEDKEAGVLVKLAGKGELNQARGRSRRSSRTRRNCRSKNSRSSCLAANGLR